MIQECFGDAAMSSVETMEPVQLPAILLVYKVRGSLGIQKIIRGT